MYQRLAGRMNVQYIYTGLFSDGVALVAAAGRMSPVLIIYIKGELSPRGLG